MKANLRNVVLWVLIALLMLGVFTFFQSPNSRLTGTEITARPEDGLHWFVSLLVSWLPFFVLIGTSSFLSRHMRKKKDL